MRRGHSSGELRARAATAAAVGRAPEQPTPRRFPTRTGRLPQQKPEMQGTLHRQLRRNSCPLLPRGATKWRSGLLQRWISSSAGASANTGAHHRFIVMMDII